MSTALDLAHPFEGRWLVQNSPANRVPSHGTTRFATAYAIDFVPVDEHGRTARFGLSSLLRPESPDHFPGFGRPILAPIAGTVVATHGSEPDHPAHRGLPSVGYALSQGRRAAAGWLALAGNHVFIQTDRGPVIALCHLQRDSISVAVGDLVTAGEPAARCGNSGNSTEPHLHLQAISTAEVARAQAVSITIGGGLPRNGEFVRA
ncbi:peptidase [Enemella evansiae]|uniref:M23 family metallopeptidase n=1 Tax=Enemella evansiae TaxID=2016499 RepID=UPI000B9737F0|nr:M23 family metallopeptidase [Enemella evansiae]OYO15639.1 peptidase [Enemella evansiae]